MACLNSLIAADILAEGLGIYADVEYTPLGEVAARLDRVRGQRPVLYIDTGASEQDVCRAMMEALLALAFGPDAAQTANPTRRLRSVV